MAHHDIELITMDDEQPSTVGRLVHLAVANLYPTEVGTEVVAEKLVMIARKIYDTSAFAGLAKDLLDHVIVQLWPVPVSLQTPAINHITDEIKAIGLMAAMKAHQELRLAATRSEMRVGYEDCANASCGEIQQRSAQLPFVSKNARFSFQLDDGQPKLWPDRNLLF